jgi:hypothetical protein
MMCPQQELGTWPGRYVDWQRGLRGCHGQSLSRLLTSEQGDCFRYQHEML